MDPESSFLHQRKEVASVDHTVDNHLKLMEDKFTVFSDAIAEVTGVNSTLEELIANDSSYSLVIDTLDYAKYLWFGEELR